MKMEMGGALNYLGCSLNVGTIASSLGINRRVQWLSPNEPVETGGIDDAN
jgi:hypothetical protein